MSIVAVTGRGGNGGGRPATVLEGESAPAVPETVGAGGDGETKAAETASAQAAPVVRARALFSYKANPSDPHEISLEKDEIVTIMDRKGNWWRARKEDGTLGIVPSNYMEVI